MVNYARLQDILGYQFNNSTLLYEATIAAGVIPKERPGGEVGCHGNKVLALIGDALIRLDVATRAHLDRVGPGKLFPYLPLLKRKTKTN